MKRFTLKTLMLLAGLTLTSNVAMAGDGTKENPYTPAELNAAKEALAASGETVWVKADLRGLGEDGASQSNADTKDENKTVQHLAALFGDEKVTFVAYSWAILGQLDLGDLTNKKDLLIALTYGTTSHPYGNTASPQYASNYEPTTEHFSLVEVHGALSVKIENGLLGYHVPASYIIPEKMIAVKVSAGYKNGAPAYVNYTNFDGATATYITPKNAALVLMAQDGTYDLTLTSNYFEQTISNGNALNAGTQAGVNAGTTNNRARFAFVNYGNIKGFERNSNENCTVTLAKKSDVFLQVSSLETNFYGNYPWETETKNWITWGGGHYSDFHALPTLFDFEHNNMDLPVGDAQHLNDGDMAGEPVVMGNVTLTVIDPEGAKTPSRYFTNNKGIYLNLFKEASVKLSVPEGKAITAVEFTFQNSQNGLNADCGTYESGSWTGNAAAVYFTAPGSRMIYSITVTVGDADDKTTPDAIETIRTDAAGRVQPTDNTIFDLSGRRVSQPVRGLYIIGGKKVVVK